MEKNMRFSADFCNDLKELMLECFKNNTDSLTLEFKFDEFMLDVDMTFNAHREENK